MNIWNFWDFKNFKGLVFSWIFMGLRFVVWSFGLLSI